MKTYSQPPDTVDPQELWAQTVPEVVFQQQVAQTAVDNGWLVHHHDTTAPTNVFYRKFNKQSRQFEYVSIRSRQIIGPGFPDLVLVHPVRGLVIFAELKVQKGKRSHDQIHWANSLNTAGANYYLWRPSDMAEIERMLVQEGE